MNASARPAEGRIASFGQDHREAQSAPMHLPHTNELATPDGPWWQRAVVYQIYPRSFADSNGDGIGDLPGITARLDHLQALGIDMVWLSPIYASPDDDNGYDISDYRAIHADFGTMADFDAMLAAMRARGIRLMMDLVVNHTSDEHEWFRQARSSRSNPYHDYYIWAEPVDGGPPTNWESIFGGSAWEWNEATGEYYLHLFTRRQPDLNWENPQVREEVKALTRFWLDKGVDGFRMDAVNLISKTYTADGRLLDAPVRQPGFLQPVFEAVANGPRLQEFLHELKRDAIAHHACVTVAEMAGVGPELAAELTDARTGCVDMIFQFEHMALDEMAGRGKWILRPMDWPGFSRCMARWQRGLAGRGWNSLYLNNHDQPRAPSRLGDGSAECAKMLALLLHGQQGTPYVYQGEELGMRNYPFAGIEECRDVETLNLWREWTGALGRSAAETLHVIRAKGRDNARIPMPWDDSAQGGFTTGTPWIAAHPDHPTLNARAQREDPRSVFHFYRELIALRHREPMLASGRFEPLIEGHAQVIAYTRTLEQQQGTTRCLVLCNLTGNSVQVPWPDGGAPATGDLLLSSLGDPPAAGLATLRPWEAVLMRL